MLLALVLSMSVLPTAAILASSARSDLASALDDYHNTKSSYAARGAVHMVKANLAAGGSGLINWPDQEITLDIQIEENETGWVIRVTAVSDRAAATAEGEGIKPTEKLDTDEEGAEALRCK